MKTKSKLLHDGLSLLTAGAALLSVTTSVQAADKKPNIVIIWGDDIGQTDISAYSHGVMGFKTPNIDRIAKEGMMFTDYYAEQSCTAGRASFITGQSGLRTGMTKVAAPGAPKGLSEKDPTTAELLKPLGYATAQFGKNHLGDRNEFLPTMRGYGRATGGDTPFFALSSFGTRADLRGYTPGRYRDKLMFAVQAEYRWRMTERLGVVAFGGVGSVAPEIGQFDKLLPSVGTGLRYVIAKKNNLSFRFDAAWGRDEHTFYVGIGEAF